MNIKLVLLLTALFSASVTPCCEVAGINACVPYNVWCDANETNCGMCAGHWAGRRALKSNKFDAKKHMRHLEKYTEKKRQLNGCCEMPGLNACVPGNVWCDESEGNCGLCWGTYAGRRQLKSADAHEWRKLESNKEHMRHLERYTEHKRKLNPCCKVAVIDVCVPGNVWCDANESQCGICAGHWSG